MLRLICFSFVLLSSASRQATATLNEAGAELFDYKSEITQLKERLKKSEDAALTSKGEQSVLKQQILSQSTVNIQLHRELAKADLRFSSLEAALVAQKQDFQKRLVQAQKRNVKEYAWTKLNQQLDEGLLLSVKFRKNNASTALKITYNGNLRARTFVDGPTKCGRWYFKINGKECSDPAPIDGVIHVDHIQNLHFPTTIEGLCSSIPAGDVQIDFLVGKCPYGYTLADNYTCWNSSCKILVEEM